MAVTNQELFNIFLANPNMSDAQIVSLMETRGISPEQISSTFNIPVGDVISRAAATVAPGNSVTLGDTRLAPQYDVRGSGEDQQIGGITNILVEKTTGDVNYKAPVGSEYQVYGADGEFQRTGVNQKVDSGLKEFALGAGLLFGLPSILNAGAVGAPAIGNGAFLGEGVASGIPAFDTAFTSAGGAFNPAFGLPVGNGAFLGEGVLSGVPEFDTALANATVGATGLTAAGTLPTTATSLFTPAATALTPTALTPAATATIPVATTAASTIPAATAATTAASALSPTATSIAKSLIPTAVKSLFTPTNIGNILQQGTQTAAGLLQQQTSREAAQKAQAMIDAETAAAKAASQFRPIGMTTRFGTSQFAVDPVTGQLTSAGYTLSPEAKNAQDRLVKLAEAGLVQAEGAQQAFAPLQTGAQRLFGLGNQYLAQSPQDVAQNYLNQQMALLQPGRELELATLQNRLQQQGRGGLAVAQGGAYGATTPELQALYNARAMQEAQLAAQAQQAGQQQVAFGAGLLGTGAQTMGQYYGGQQQAYAPFTTALGQVQGLEQLAQQPLQMGASLGQQASAAGFNVGRLGLQGAGQSVALATGADATRNPYASALSGASANPVFGQVVGGLFGTVPPVTAMSAPATTFGTGTYYGNQDLGLFL